MLKSGNIPPKSYLYDRITTIINQRKLDILKSINKEILNDAIKSRKYEVYKKFISVINFSVFIYTRKIKVDGISSVVGDFIIDSYYKVLIDMESQGLSTSVSKCQLLGKLMEDKLYAHHAIQDSLELSDNEIYDYVDRQLEYFTEQLGGIDKVLEFYNKRDELSFRDELFEINKTQRLSR